jgi:hypothetical protein
MTFSRCRVCADISVNKSGRWRPFTKSGDKAVTLETLQASFLECQSGGCKILLKAISKVCPDASSTAQLLSVYNFNGNAIITCRKSKEDIELFVSEGISPV